LSVKAIRSRWVDVDKNKLSSADGHVTIIVVASSADADKREPWAMAFRNIVWATPNSG
jgi:hypothetical protein